MAEKRLSSADQMLNVYSRLVESLSDLVAVVDRQHVYRMVNPAYSQRYGKAPDQIVGRTIAQLLGDDVFRAVVMPPLHRCFAGQPVSYEGWFSYPTLGPRYMEVQYYPLHGNGQVEYVVALIRDATERKQAEEALRESERQYRELFESARALFHNSSDAVFVHELTESGMPGRIVEANAVACRKFGFDRSEYMAMSPEDIYAVVPKDAMPGFLRQLAARGHVSFETTVTCKDGTRTPVEVAAYSFVLHGEKVALSILHDVSDRKRAEQLLRESEERYHTVADFAYDWESWLDPKRNYIYVSPSCERITGYPADEFLADPDLVERIAHPADRALFTSHLHEEPPSSRGIRHLDFRIITRDGGVRWISHFCQPVYGKDGSWLGWRASNRDITERKQVEEALRESEERFRKIFEGGPLGMAIVGLDRHFLAANPTFCEMTGYTEKELRQLSVSDITYPQDIEKSIEFARRLRRADMPYPHRLEKRYLRKNGEVFWGRVTVSMLRGCDGEPIHAVAMVEDIAEQKEAEQLQEQYISFVSHDLRSPLSVVVGQAGTLHQQLVRKGLEREAERVGSILQNCWRMNSMIEDLVETTRMESGQMKMRKVPTDLGQLATAIAGRVGTPEQGARIRVECPDCLPPVPIDQERIERAFVNLITNALKYSPPDSPVILKVALGDGQALISVIDEGVGIPPEDLPWVFERFYRAVTGKKTEGLGLGLYITRLIVEAHGGRVWVESEVGKGSAFHLSLPLSQRVTSS